MMKQLQGLLKKECIQMKNWLIVLLVTGAFLLLVGPSALKRIFGLGDDIGTIGFMTGLILIFLHSGVIVIMLLTTLEKDMTRPDIWFHTPASTLKLISAKFIFSLFVITVSLVFASCFTFAYFNMTAEKTSSIVDLMRFALLINGGTILISIYVASVSFFFWVLYRTLYSQSRTLAGIITIVIFFLANYWWDRLLASSFFTKLFMGMGEISFQHLLASDLLAQTFNFDISDGPSVQITEVLFIGGTMAILFAFSVIWFDKKVRV